MMQSYHILGDQSLRIPFWTEVQGWCNPATFSGTEASGYLSEPRFKDDAILPHSRGPKPPYTFLNRSSRMMQSFHILRDRSLRIPFWTEVQGWCNPTTFSRTEASGYILNKSSRMIQSYHILEYRIHRSHSEQNFKHDTILPHSRVPKSLDPFWTKVQGWYC